MSLTAMPESRSSLAVPPVEMSSMPSAASLRAKATSPVLSVTLRRARCMRGDMLASDEKWGDDRRPKILSAIRGGWRDLAGPARGCYFPGSGVQADCPQKQINGDAHDRETAAKNE